MSRLRRWHWPSLAVAALGAYALAPANAPAEIAVSAQALADDGAFLAYAPRPAHPAGLCLVDTGVNINPDTEGSVVYRTALDGGSGDDVSPTQHGTVLAMMAAAPANGWGMVGTAPESIKIVSVRILQPGKTTFPLASYADGITVCLELRKQYNIRVINLSLGSPDVPSNEDYERINNSVQVAHNYGVNVVGASGNDDGGPIEYPAAIPSVLSVGASDTNGGALCTFANRGAGLRLLAPGCDLDGADPATGIANYNYWQGSSESSDISASAVGALESYRPELSPQAAADAVTSAANGVLDIAQSFRNTGLGQIVSAGEAAEPVSQPPTGSTSASSPQSVRPSEPMRSISGLQRPHARLRRLKGRLVLSLSGRPSSAETEVRYLGHRHHAHALSVLRTRSGKFTTVTVPNAGVSRILVRYTDSYDITRVGPWSTLDLPKRSARPRKRSHRP